MDFVEINKFTKKSRVDLARDNMYYCRNIQSDDATVLIIYACRKMYGLSNTVKILHSFGLNKIKCNL